MKSDRLLGSMVFWVFMLVGLGGSWFIAIVILNGG